MRQGWEIVYYKLFQTFSTCLLYIATKIDYGLENSSNALQKTINIGLRFFCNILYTQ